MTTENLIELAKYCTKRNFNSYASCKDCPYDNNALCQDMLLLDVAERLEKAYIDLKNRAIVAPVNISISVQVTAMPLQPVSAVISGTG